MNAQMSLNATVKQRKSHVELLPFIRAANEEWAIQHRPALQARDAEMQQVRQRRTALLEQALETLSDADAGEVRKLVFG